MTLKLKITSQPHDLRNMRHAIHSFLDHIGMEDTEAALIVLALDEACTNIIRYAYQHKTTGTIRMEARQTRNGLRFLVRDYGACCNPSQFQHREPVKDRQGGLGVFIIQTVFDKVDYQPMPRGTCLTLFKRWMAASNKQQIHS